MSPSRKCEAVHHHEGTFEVSERRACTVLDHPGGVRASVCFLRRGSGEYASAPGTHAPPTNLTLFTIDINSTSRPNWSVIAWEQLPA